MEFSLTSISALRQLALSHFMASISFIYFSISALFFSSLNLDASKAPRIDASCVCTDKAGFACEGVGDSDPGADEEFGVMGRCGGGVLPLLALRL